MITPSKPGLDGPFIVAEIAQAHDGSLGIAHSYIDAIAEAGAQAAKFQVHLAEAESSEFEEFRVRFSYCDRTRYDYWKRTSFKPEEWKGLKSHCEDRGLAFVASPFSIAAVDLLESLGTKIYKIASGEVENWLLLDRIAKAGGEVILSSGMSSLSEIEESVTFLRERKADPVVLQCTTSYPTSAENVGLHVIPELKKRFGPRVGLSDHSGTVYPGLAAIVLGAAVVEVHVVFDKRMFGPDASSSVNFSQLRELTEGADFLHRALNKSLVNKDDVEHFQKLKAMFGKSLASRRDLPTGSVIALEDLETKKPAGKGIPARLYQEVIGRRTAHEIRANEFLSEKDLR